MGKKNATAFLGWAAHKSQLSLHRPRLYASACGRKADFSVCCGVDLLLYETCEISLELAVREDTKGSSRLRAIESRKISRKGHTFGLSVLVSCRERLRITQSGARKFVQASQIAAVTVQVRKRRLTVGGDGRSPAMRKRITAGARSTGSEDEKKIFSGTQYLCGEFSGAIDARSCFSSGEHSQANEVVIAFISLCSRRESY